MAACEQYFIKQCISMKCKKDNDPSSYSLHDKILAKILATHRENILPCKIDSNQTGFITNLLKKLLFFKIRWLLNVIYIPGTEHNCSELAMALKSRQSNYLFNLMPLFILPCQGLLQNSWRSLSYSILKKKNGISSMLVALSDSAALLLCSSPHSC